MDTNDTEGIEAALKNIDLDALIAAEIQKQMPVIEAAISAEIDKQLPAPMDKIGQRLAALEGRKNGGASSTQFERAVRQLRLSGRSNAVSEAVYRDPEAYNRHCLAQVNREPETLAGRNAVERFEAIVEQKVKAGQKNPMSAAVNSHPEEYNAYCLAKYGPRK